MKPYSIQNVPEDLSNFYTIVFTIHKTSGTFCVCASYDNNQFKWIAQNLKTNCLSVVLSICECKPKIVTKYGKIDRQDNLK